MNSALPDGLAVLSAMITPAVLLSACASLIIATASRLNRAVDRARELSQRFAELQNVSGDDADAASEARQLFRQLDFATSRSRLLQRALSGLYYSVGSFVATSVAIAIVALTDRGVGIPITLGIAGAGLLLDASLLLVRESRVALLALETEMDYVWAQGKARAPQDWLKRARGRRGLRKGAA